MVDAYIVSAKRSPVVSVQGAYSNLSLWELAGPVIEDCIKEISLDKRLVDDVWLGNGLCGGGNPARAISLYANLPEDIPAKSIDTQCCSGMDAIIAAILAVQSGNKHAVIAGGVESYSRRPLRLIRPKNDNVKPTEYQRPPFTPWQNRDPEMVDAAAKLADLLKISRQDQIKWAIESHGKALHAQKSDINNGELSHINGTNIYNDSYTRRLTEAVCLRSKVLAGSIDNAIDTSTAAASADAAAAVIVVSKELLENINVRHKVLCKNFTQVGGNPCLPGLAPIAAINKTLLGCSVDAHDLWASEIMEAFAVQAIACVQGAGLRSDRVNISGGALARGHPIGASGAILVVRLFHELKRAPKGALGLAAIAAAGGLGSSILLSV